MIRLKLTRLLNGRTQFEVSHSARISQGRYSMLERGLVQPTPAEREVLAQILKVPANGLFRSTRPTR